MAERPGTPLALKLGIRPDSTLLIVGDPGGISFDLPAGVFVRHETLHPADVVVAYFTSAESLRELLAELADLIFPDGGLWIVWPKRSSGISSDIGDHVVRELALPLGLVDNKVCSVDDSWTGLRLVWRRENRQLRPPSP